MDAATDTVTDGWGVSADITSGWAEESSPAPVSANESKTEEPPAPTAAISTNGISKSATPVLVPAKSTPVTGAMRSWAQVAR